MSSIYFDFSHLYQYNSAMAKQETGNLPEIAQRHKPEALKKHYTTGVIMPYSSDLHPKTGEPDLSIFSKFAVIAAYKGYQNGVFDKFFLCGEQTFGPDKKSTTDLMQEMLIRLGVPQEDIQLLPETENLDNTAYQIKALAQYQKDNPDSSFLIIDYDFHNSRIKNHISGFGLEADTVTVQDLFEHYFKKSNLRKFDDIFEEFEKRERWSRRLSTIDRKGLIPRSITGIIGASVTNVEMRKNGLEFVSTTAKKRQRQLAARKS